MRESLLTIPISEIFEPKSGCPVCRMRDMLEGRTVEYIMGAAMMEPDVRIETNRAGFCHTHLMQMMTRPTSTAYIRRHSGRKSSLRRKTPAP